MARISFTEASLIDLNFPKTAKGLKGVMLISAPLSMELAEQLKCKQVFQPNGDPVGIIEGVSLKTKLRDVVLHFPDGKSFRPEIIWKLNIKSINDIKLAITFRAHVNGDAEAFELLELRKQYLNVKFDCAITSLQAEFDFSGEAAGGTPVSMSGEEEQDEDAEATQGTLLTQCQHCLAGIQIDPGGSTHTLADGITVQCSDIPRSRPPALASITQMGGRRGRPKKVQPEPTEKEIEQGVEVSE